MSYITSEMSTTAIRKMKDFHDSAIELYEKFDMDLLSNLGRRNIILSQTQEKFFAQTLSSEFAGVVNDGRTGQPDIVIKSLNKELECKLTSRTKHGSISFQTDYQTLLNKGSIDYLYMISDTNFENFCVLHFLDLTTDDFRVPANGSRGKAGMYKHRGMKKCHVLHGAVRSLNEENLEKIEKRISATTAPGKLKKLLERKKYWETVPEKYSFDLAPA